MQASPGGPAPAGIIFNFIFCAKVSQGCVCDVCDIRGWTAPQDGQKTLMFKKVLNEENNQGRSR